MRRLRAIEERIDLMDGRIENMQSSAIKAHEESVSQFNKLSGIIKTAEERVLKVENDVMKVGKGLENTAKDSDMKHLQQLVELYTPFKKRAD